LAFACATSSATDFAGRAGIDHEHVGEGGDVDDRNEVLGRIEGEPGQVREHRVRAQPAHEQRVAVGRRARRGFGADRARAAGAVLDHDRLAVKSITSFPYIVRSL
jgi:hypothetical protein